MCSPRALRFDLRQIRSLSLGLALVSLLSCLTPCPLAAGAASQSLAGRWRFALDREDAGIRQRWFERGLEQRLQLPGSLPAQGIGDDVTVDTKWTGGIVDRSFFTAPEYAPYREPGHVKVPFWLQPDKYYAGPAWYQRDFKVPRAWENQRVVLSLERPHWETRVWVDGRCAGTNLSLSTPHESDLGTLAPGKHTLSIRVDNRLVIDVGHDSHSVSDHTQGNWNGIVGRIELRATPPVWLDDLQVYPNLARSSVRVRGRIGNASGQAGRGVLAVSVREAATRQRRDSVPGILIPVSWRTNGGSFECEIPVPQAKPWDEFQPRLYTAEAILKSSPTARDSKAVLFGFRDFSAQGTQFTINGRKTFVRGTLECCVFPKTGHPPTDIDSWRRLIRVAKAHGLNNLRFHSWCPPEAAFRAADELGMYLHVECSSWANSSTTLGDGKPVDQWIYDEADRILRYYGNHPSFVMMLYGNEPGGKHYAEFLSKWVRHYREADPRRLYSAAAGWPQLPENQFHVTPDPRIQAWGAGLSSRINAAAPETRTDYRQYIAARSVPVISHEIGQWCVYPNFDEMKKYTGYLKPRNFEIFRDRLAAHHMADQARSFLFASGKLQALCYKEDIESALRTPGMGGFQLLDLHDFPGQGTALVGVLDPFWEEKGYITAAQFRRFCGPTVPLARLSRRVFTQADKSAIELEVAHFGPAPLRNVWPVFKFVGDDGKVYQAGHFEVRDIEIGNGQVVGHWEPVFKDLPAPERYKLVFGLARKPTGKGLICENDWDVWVYPPHLPSDPPSDPDLQTYLKSPSLAPSDGERVRERGFAALVPNPNRVRIVQDLTEDAVTALAAGGRVLWLIPPARVAPDKKSGKVALGFSSIFWNTAWTHRQAPHTLGILCNPKHPLFEAFPTDGYSNWQWWYLITRAGAMILDDLPPKLRPAVQVIDDWFTARKLGLVFEAKVGAGRLLVCSIDLNGDLEANPVARQFRYSLLRYMASGRFKPRTEVTLDQLRKLVLPASDARQNR
jgi:Glycosyl hydrolases family 2, sugar binding domain/Glycosyl hydrolases family 2/Glycosyl hydrolases family 2, TIM barrel domain